MATQIRFRRGTTAQHATFIGAAGEVTVDTDKKTVVVHDGVTPGGQPLPTTTTNVPSDNSVSTAKIQDNAVTNAKMADNSVNTAEIVNGALSADTAGRAKMADGYVTESKLSSSVLSLISSSNTPGLIAAFAQDTAPTGWLKANGAAVSRTAYANLFSAIGTTFGVGDGSTTFNLPDLRSEFIRGWDDGRGVDTGRVFGSAQASQNLAHNHTGTTDSQGAHVHDVISANTAGGTVTRPQAATLQGTTVTASSATSSAGAHAHNLTIANSGGTEARPRNIALLFCIKF